MATIWDEVIPHGSKQGMRVLDVFRTDPGYLYWYALEGHSAPLANGLARLFGPADIPIESVEIDAVLSEAKLQINALPNGTFSVTGDTYPTRHLLKLLGGWFNKHEKTYVFSQSPLEELVLSLVDPNTLNSCVISKLDPDGEPARLRARKVRSQFDSLEDLRRSDDTYLALLSEETRVLLAKGIEAGIPETVVTEQAVDAGMMVDAFTRSERLFLLASEAGSGKTFVLAAGIREMLARNPDLRIVYVTLRKSLINQIKNDIADYGVLERIEFVTYNGIGKSLPDVDWSNTVLALDEAHSAKNHQGSKAGMAAAEMLGLCRMAVYASATLYESPVEMAYLEPSGLFEPAGFEQFALAHGAKETIKVTPNNWGGTRQERVLSWSSNATTLEGARAAREFLVRRGVFTQRQKRLPTHLVTTNFRDVEADPHWLQVFADVTAAYHYAAEIAQAKNQNDSILLAQMRGAQKRVLEAAKVQAAIKHAQQAHANGQQVALFVETKSSRLIGNDRPFEQLEALFNEWDSLPFSHKTYPPPISKAQLCLAQAYAEMGINHTLPSIIDELVAGLGRDNVGIFVGAASFESVSVTDASAERDLKRWKAGELPFLVCTQSKGGTGLSLHPTRSGQPRTQVNLTLPWTAKNVDQLAGRVARYGMASPVCVDWLLAPDIPLEAQLAKKVAGRMQAQGATVSGSVSVLGKKLSEAMPARG